MADDKKATRYRMFLPEGMYPSGDQATPQVEVRRESIGGRNDLKRDLAA
jgi:hypothetical protein